MNNMNIGQEQIYNERLDYVDMLKGFAILLVVMGHFLSWQWGGPVLSNVPEDIKYLTLLKRIIYSFHMPLFFFLSGYVFMRKMKILSLKDIFVVVYKRFRSIIIPGIFYMAIYFFSYHQYHFPWFLRAIFELFIVNIIVYYIAQKYQHKLFVEIIAQGLIYVFLQILSKQFGTTMFFSILNLNRCVEYMPYFFIGTMSYRYNLIMYLQKHPSIGGMALFLGGGLLWTIIAGENIHGGRFIPYFAILVCLQVSVLSNNLNKLSKTLKYVGKNTLIIYLYSQYFLPCNSCLGQILEMFGDDDFGSAFISQFVLSLFFSAIAILFCLAINNVIEKSPVTRFLILGK